MLAIPVKRADISELAKPLKDFFSKKFPKDSSHFQNDITSFQQLRTAAVSVSDPMDQVGQQQLLRFIYHMRVMVLRLNDLEAEMKLPLSWYDAYRPSRRFSSNNLYFDIAGVLWNMGAFESMRAARVDRSTDEGIRLASKGFQQAGGIFSYIQESVAPKLTHGLSPDLTNESLEMAKTLMLAQAQACFYEKAVRDRKVGGTMKPAIISKLAFEASSLFGAALSFARQGTMVTSLDASWPALLTFQQDCFLGAAEYWASMSAKEVALQRASGYGEEIARLARAESSLLQAISVAKTQNLTATLAGAAQDLLNAVRQLKASAESDNNKIYLEVVPNPASLPILTGAKMVKLLEFPEYYNTEKPLFKDFTPSEVRAMVDRYRAALETLCRNQEEVVAAADNAVRSALSAQGLPASLEMYKSGGQLPENLWLKIEQVQRLGGVRDLQSKLSEVLSSAEAATRVLTAIEDTMARENRADDTFRAKFPQYGASVIPYSDSLFAAEVRDPLASLRGSQKVAEAENEKISVLFKDEKFRSDSAVLSMSQSELSRFLNHNGSSDTLNLLESSSADTSALESALLGLATCIEQRQETLQSLRADLNAAGDLTEQVMQRRAANPTESQEAVVAFFLEKLSSKTGHLSELVRRQEGLLAEVFRLNESFKQQRSNDGASMARDRNIKVMEEAVARFFEIHGRLSSGENFYTNLLMRLSKLQRACEDVSFSQQLQRQEFEQNTVRDQDRSIQEQKDKDMAMQLSAEFNKMSTTAPPPPPAAAPFGGQGHPAGVAYGQPVSAPPGQPGAMTYGRPAPAPHVPVSGTGLNSSSYGSYPQPPSGYGGGVPVYSSAASYQSQAPRAQPAPASVAGPPQYGSVAGAYGGPPSYGSAATQPAPQMQYSYGGYAPTGVSAPPHVGGPVTPQPGVDEKVKRLTEMGFDFNSSFQALNMYNGNEEAAINYLIGGGSSGSAQPQQQSAAPQPQEPPKPAKKGWW